MSRVFNTYNGLQVGDGDERIFTTYRRRSPLYGPHTYGARCQIPYTIECLDFNSETENADMVAPSVVLVDLDLPIISAITYVRVRTRALWSSEDAPAYRRTDVVPAKAYLVNRYGDPTTVPGWVEGAHQHSRLLAQANFRPYWPPCSHYAGNVAPMLDFGMTYSAEEAPRAYIAAYLRVFALPIAENVGWPTGNTYTAALETTIEVVGF